jgi:putative membrane protein
VTGRAKAPIQVVRGFCMGAADVVPGVSGGTIALVFGIYTTLVAQIRQGARSLAQLVRGRPAAFVGELRLVDWWFLVPLLAGVGTALVTLASVISHFLEEEPIRTAGVFFGLVVGSLATTVRLVKRWDTRNSAVGAAAAVATFVLLGLGSGQVDEPALPFVFVGGSIAICAMILPGISGSFLLLMLGLYHPVLDAVDERDLILLLTFTCGAVIGLALFSSALSWALDRHEQPMLAGLIGLMVGSLRVLWPWPNGTGSEESTDGAELALPAGDVVWPVVLAVVAAAAILLLTRFAGERSSAEPVIPADV